jgi:outer membrane lipoprotein-sorting protein
MKKIIYTILALPLLINISFAETDEEKGLKIAKQTYENSRGFVDSQSDQVMILIDPNGNEVVREIAGKTLENNDPNDGDKSITFFKKPKDVEGTIMLSHTHIIENDDQWIYLPALGRVKRISSSNKSGSFMGSEIAFEDFSGSDYRKYDWKYLGEEENDGEVLFKIESFPKYENSGYTKRIGLTDDQFRTRKIDFYDRKSELLKTIFFEDYNLYLDKIWFADTFRVVNHQNKNSTIFKWLNREFDIGLDERDFEKSSLLKLAD